MKLSALAAVKVVEYPFTNISCATIEVWAFRRAVIQQKTKKKRIWLEIYILHSACPIVTHLKLCSMMFK